MAQEVVHLGLCADHTFKASETFQMGFAEVGDEAVRWFGDSDQFGDIAHMVRAHLDHGDLVFVREPEQGERNTDVVVEIPYRCQSRTVRAEHFIHQFFCRGLSICTGDREHRDAELATMEPGQFL